jgi:sulfite exporter TauE/SafE
MIIQYLTEGFLLGLATGHICILTCGPIYSPFLMQRKYDLLQSLIALLKISAGRFITYLLFGIIAGFLGQQIGQLNRTWFTAIAYFLLSLILFATAFRTHKKDQGCHFKKWTNFIDSPFLLGLVTGINYCPSFLIAITRAVDLSGPVSGAMLFIAFFFGTSIFLLPLTLFGIMGNKKILRTTAIIASIAVGSWFIYKAINSIAHLVTTNARLVTIKNEIQKEYERGNVITLLDSTDAYILSSDTSSFTVLRDVLTEHKKGSVILISDTSRSISNECYILTDSKWNMGNYTGLRRENRFVMILSPPAGQGLYDREYGKNLVRYLDKCYFKWNKEKGTFYNMAKAKMITKQIEKKINQ